MLDVWKHFGLEARTPFADRDLVAFVMSIPPHRKRFGGESGLELEKTLMRVAFTGLLPHKILWRPKTAFSDGVSQETRSWHKIISEHVDSVVSDAEFAACQWTDPKPLSKEAYYYRREFVTALGDREDLIKMIGEYWMPRFVEANDPSAREL